LPTIFDEGGMMGHRREWRCPNCGSLRHGSRPERCPECGWIFRDNKTFSMILDAD
jgi:rubrerythrin